MKRDFIRGNRIGQIVSSDYSKNSDYIDKVIYRRYGQNCVLITA